jgi:DNA mismatch repair protein MutS2
LNASKPEINTIDYQIDTNTNLSIGMSVNVNPLNVVGTIVNINEKSETAEVLIGNIKSIIKKENLIPIILPKVEKIQPIKTNKNLINNSFSPEINLIGKSVMDASYELDIYLNKAILSSIDKIKIIHGMGTGKLKEGLRAFLKSSTFVKSFREGDYFEGGMGVTIVTLKK